MSESSARRIGWLGLATIWFGGMISVPSLLIGSTLIAGLTFRETLIAGFVGFSVVSAFMSLESVAAVDRRLDTVSLATSSFGRSGARIILGLALGVSLIGWFGVQSGIAGSSLSRITSLSWGVSVPPSVASFLLGVFMMLTAVFGFRYMKYLNYVAVPCKVLLVVYAMIVAFQTKSFSLVTDYVPAADKQIDLWTGIGLSIGFFSVGGVISPDYARHAKTRTDAVLGSVLGLMPAALGMAACGAMLAIVQQTYDIVEIYATLGMPLLALSVLIIATWTTNVMNAYSSGLALNQLLHWPESRRSLATLVAGLLGSAVAAAGILGNFMGFLMLLTITIPPIAGVLVSDYWIARSYKENGSARFEWRGILSWAAGVGTMLLFAHPLRSVASIAASACLYLLLRTLERNRPFIAGSARSRP